MRGRSLVVGALLSVMGCYSVQPVTTAALPLGSQVVLVVSDVGRVELAGQMGPAIDRLEGRLVGRDSGQMMVSVTLVHLLRGGEQVWRGERVALKNEYVTQMQERRFSRGKTALVSAAAIGVVAAIASKGLAGFGNRDPDKPPVDSADAIRIVRP